MVKRACRRASDARERNYMDHFDGGKKEERERGREEGRRRRRRRRRLRKERGPRGKHVADGMTEGTRYSLVTENFPANGATIK